MSEPDDRQLLAEFTRTHSEAAFAALARRHLNLVYSVALRSVGNTHAAEEISQAVFIILAQKAKPLSQKIVLSGWLYQTTRLTAANFLRGEIRRQKREQEAYMQSTLDEPDETIWSQIAPLLDDALAKLGERDRNAIVLRFFENKNLREVGLAMNASEDATKMRVNRALEKLRKMFSKRGVTLTAAIIAGAVSANSVQAAPAGLVMTITAAAAKGAAVSGSTLTIIKGALKIMAWTKVKTAVVVGATLLLATGTATFTIPMIRHAYLEHKVVWTLDNQALDREPPVVLIRPAKPIPGVSRGGGGYIRGGSTTNGKMIGLKTSILTMLLVAYQDPTYSDGIHTHRVIISANLPKESYDFIASTPKLQRQALQQELKSKFGLVAHLETRDADVLVLKVKNPFASGLKLSKTTGGSTYEAQGKLFIRGGSMSLMAGFIEDSVLQIPVIDRTGLTNTYDLDLTWNVQGRDWNRPSRPILDGLLLDQLGLELVSTNMPIEMLIVEKAEK